MQRFGVGNVSTHIIGKYVIKKLWKEAFTKILTTDSMIDAMKQVGLGTSDVQKEIFDIEDKNRQMTIITDILKILPKFTNENKLLFNYKKIGKNSYQSAFKSLSKQLQVLYPHSYQSYIWNMTVSYRISKYGRKLIIGDIVKKHEPFIRRKIRKKIVMLVMMKKMMIKRIKIKKKIKTKKWIKYLVIILTLLQKKILTNINSKI